MKKEFLKKNYKEFWKCFTNMDFIQRADSLNTSREYYYRIDNGSGTNKTNDVLNLIEYDGIWGEIKGFIRIEVHNMYGNIVCLEIPIDIIVSDWSEEDSSFTNECYSICDVDEW